VHAHTETAGSYGAAARFVVPREAIRRPADASPRGPGPRLWRLMEGVAMKGTRTTSEVTGLNGTTVREAMHEGVLSCPTWTPLSMVAELMAGNGVHCVVVTDENDATVWGVVSDLDLVAAATVRSLDDQQAGGTAMTPAITASPHESLESAAERMTRHGASHLVVVDSSRRPVGVLSTLDLVRTIAAAAPERRSHVTA